MFKNFFVTVKQFAINYYTRKPSERTDKENWICIAVTVGYGLILNRFIKKKIIHGALQSILFIFGMTSAAWNMR